MNPTRGERNHNPINLEDEGIAWKGRCGHDGPYCIFDTDTDGLRAGALDLLHAQTLHGRNTVTAIITPFAPASENDTAAYINAVSEALQVDPDQAIDLRAPSMLEQLLRAVVVHENGRCVYSDDQLQQAVKEATA
jgi:hypothetical protein